MPGYQPNYSMAGPREAPTPQPPSNSGYMTVSVIQTMARDDYPLIFCHPMKPIVQYDNPGQGEPSCAPRGYDFAANQPHGQTSFSPPLSGAHAVPNNQGASPVWCLSNSWVNYAVEDELHVTIAFRKIPSA